MTGYYAVKKKKKKLTAPLSRSSKYTTYLWLVWALILQAILTMNLTIGSSSSLRNLKKCINVLKSTSTKSELY